MKTIPSIMLLILATAPLANCAPKGSKGSPANQTPATAVGTGTGSGNANAAGTTGAAVPAPATATTAAITADYWPSGYWLGFDGKTTFSLLLAGGRGGATYTVADPTIASIAPVSFTIDQATHDSLWASCEKINPSANQQLFESRYAVGTNITSYKLTALKAGQTTLTQTVKANSGFGPNGGGPGGGGGQPKVIFVTQYPDTAVAVGSARYNNNPAVPTATTPACGPACHGNAAHGAPNHALGQVETLPDAAVAKWIKTGSLPYVNLNAQTDKGISHNWTFASADEETGVIAYLRTLQASNFEELITLEFQGDTQAAKICSLSLPPGVGPTATGSGTH
ncbi:MAG: hypothetical protein NTZ90_17655 [Proteobacteria bacterium]|nr:hypothetical protein [Pseudomonadota bacterium]